MTQTSATARMVIHRAPLDVYEAFANPEIMARFWFPAGDDRMEEGSRLTWSAGCGEDAPEIAVRVREARPARRLSIDWGVDGEATRVDWTFEPVAAGTLLTITESGWTGSPEEVKARALDATGDFNQLVVAAKALLEHGAEVNIVRDLAPEPEPA